MKDFQQSKEHNLYNRDAVVCGGVCNGRKAWILPGGHITHSREVAEKALRIMGRMIINELVANAAKMSHKQYGEAYRMLGEGSA